MQPLVVISLEVSSEPARRRRLCIMKATFMMRDVQCLNVYVDVQSGSRPARLPALLGTCEAQFMWYTG